MIFLIKNKLVCFSTMTVRPNGNPIRFDLESIVTRQGALFPLHYASLNLLDDPFAKGNGPDGAVLIKSDGRMYERNFNSFHGGRDRSSFYRVPVGAKCDYCRASNTNVEDRALSWLSLTDEATEEYLRETVRKATFDLPGSVVLAENIHVMPFDELVSKICSIVETRG